MSRKSLYFLVLGLSFMGCVWLSLNVFSSSTHTVPLPSVCLIKNVTDIPCPSCGTTASMLALFTGDVAGSIYYNPLGLLMTILITVLPVWIMVDLLRSKRSFHAFYEKVELALKRKVVAVPLTLVIIVLWAWNIYKTL